MREPAEWEFLYWSSPTKVIVRVISEDDGFGTYRLTADRQPFFDIVKAAHPYHEKTEAQTEREEELLRLLVIKENGDKLLSGLRRISGSVDNPSHWNRLAPEIKSRMQTHYRELLKLLSLIHI